MKKRILSLAISAALVLTMLPAGALAAGDKGTPPVYNKATGCYEISTPDQLLYLSGSWKDGAPRDGHYVLTADIDMSGVKGFKPIASKKDKGFIGTFDGQFHAIKGLRVEYEKKYAGLFGYVGNQDDQAYIKDVALLDCYVTGQQNVGALAGVNYGTITGCVVTGEVKCLDLSNSHTAGGICGKLKEGEGPIVGHVEDCYVNADVSAPYDAGGVAGIQDGGGYLARCFAAGTVDTTAKSGTVGHAGGIAGSFNAGETLKDSVSAQTVINGVADVDKIVGQLDDEAATNITGNIAWEGTLLSGNEPTEQPIKWEDVSTAKMQDKATYEALGWDMNKVWDWSTSGKQPVLRGYDASIFPAVDYTVSGTRIISRALNTAPHNGKAEVSARIVTSDKVQSATLYYGYDSAKVDTAVAMKESNGTYTASLPTDKTGDMFYYIEVKTNKETVTKPYAKSEPIVLNIDDGKVKGEPDQITITPDTKQGGLRFSWLTDPAVTKTVIQYKVKGASKWESKSGTSYVESVTAGYKEKAAHRVEITGLTPSAEYVYRVGDGGSFMSEEKSFTAPKSAADKSFKVIFYSDPQSESVENYMSFKDSIDQALKICPNPDLMISAGDTTQNGYKSTEWEACFEVMGDYYAKYPTVTVAGNHEMKGDWNFVSFAQRFNMSGAKTGYPQFDRTMGYFEYGDAIFVILNGEVTPADQKAEIMKKELQWCKSVLDASDKKWRVVMTHAGPYTSNHDPLDVRDYYINDSEYSLDAMGVDLFLNGHDHIYIRSTVKNDIKVNTGDGTTYLTGGTVGNKFYEYIPARSDYSTDFYTDEEDKQVFSIIEFNEDSIKGTAYQKQDVDNWNSFKAVDSYEIRNTLREGKSVTDYTDVPANAWYYKAADYVTKNGLLSGDKAYTFGASKALTRAQVAQALYNLAGQPKTELTDSFSDVPVTHQARTAIAWAEKTGIMEGVGGGKFSPDRSVTRQEAATLLTRQRKLSGEDTAADGSIVKQFTDGGTIADWAAAGVAYCAKTGLVQGKPGKVFAPKSTITRAEMATIMQRIAA